MVKLLLSTEWHTHLKVLMNSYSNLSVSLVELFFLQFSHVWFLLQRILSPKYCHILDKLITFQVKYAMLLMEKISLYLAHVLAWHMCSTVLCKLQYFVACHPIY